MVKQGNLNFDCSREFRKIIRANGGENCTQKIEVMKISFITFAALFLSQQILLKKRTNIFFPKENKGHPRIPLILHNPKKTTQSPFSFFRYIFFDAELSKN